MTIAARLLTTALLIAAATAPGFATDDANYPARPIRIVIGFAAGGPTDTLARIIGEHLTASCHQPVVVESRPGANGNIAMTTVAKAPPDGYTLALVPNGNASRPSRRAAERHCALPSRRSRGRSLCGRTQRVARGHTTDEAVLEGRG